MNQTKTAIGFVWPCRSEYLDDEGKEQSEYGNYIVINKDGYIVTARHVIEPPASKITYSWWGYKTNVQAVDRITGNNDLAIAKLHPFNPDRIPNFPIFGTPNRLKSKMKLYAAGFVLPEDIDLNELKKDEEGFSQYPGIFRTPETRYKDSQMTKSPNDPENKFLGYYVETLGDIQRGQSGGALIDRNAHIYGVLSGTGHYPGYNVVRSIHPEILRGLMDQIGITYQSI